MLACVVVAALSEPGAAQPGAPATVAAGVALFAGAQPLSARLRGHDETLPAFAARCANCHVSQGTNSSLAPILDRGSLTQLRSRRGGPASAFETDSFCRLLRTGIDPKDVLVASPMPVYHIADEQCAALWAFLTRSEAVP